MDEVRIRWSGRRSVVGLPLALAHAAFEKGLTAVAHQQFDHDDRRDDRDQRQWITKREDEQSDPDACITEIVGMAGPGPEPTVHHLPGIGRISFEAGKLVVSNRFEDEADGPDRDADRAEDSEGAKLVHRELDGQRHHENEDAWRP